MPFNSNLVDANNIQAKRGIFRNRSQPPAQIVRAKLSSNAIPMKPNRQKCQSKITNCKDQNTHSDSKTKRSQPTVIKGIATNVLEKPSFRLLQGTCLSNVSEVNNAATKGTRVKTTINDSCEQSQVLMVSSAHSLLFQMEHLNVDNKTAKNLAKTKVSYEELEKKTNTWMVTREQMSQIASFKSSSSNVCKETVPPITSDEYFLSATNRVSKPTPKMFENFIKNDSCLNEWCAPVVMPVHVQIKQSVVNDVKTFPSESVDELKIGDNIKLAPESKHTDLFETELETYKKYDQDAKDVIDKFTQSLDEKEKVIRKYEEELSLLNSKVCNLQNQLEESLERIRQLESAATTTNCNSTAPSNELKSENETLKEAIKDLETKLAKRDLHIFNLKEVLSIETNKIKELNKAQEEINRLQRESIDKSREISVLRDELKYAAKMRTELVNEYDEKIVKLKKLLAIREYLLTKVKS